METDSGLIRIRDAAIDQFGRAGFAGTTVRTIAAEAGVSPALIIHHFGSKDGLIRHCDEHVLSQIERLRDEHLRGGSGLETITDYLTAYPELVGMTRYLGQALLADGAVLPGGRGSRRVFDRMIDVAKNNLITGIEAGRIRPMPDLEAAAAILASWNAALIMLGDAIAERLGAASLLDPAIAERIQPVVLDIRSHGILLPKKGSP